MLTEAQWVRNNGSKLCPLVRKKILSTYRLSKWIPCFIQKPIRAVKQYFTKIPVIVQLKTEHISLLDVQNTEQLLGCRVKHRLNIIKGFSTSINIKTIQNLAVHDAIERIWLDREVEALLDTASSTVNIQPAWDDELSGKGVSIAIVDTGIYNHPDLTKPQNRIIAFKDFVNDRSEPYDDNGHGTHCAGDAAGNGQISNGKYKGPAPEANLIGVKVLNKLGSGVMSDLIAGVQWCIEQKDNYNIKVLSLSLGTRATSSYKDDPLCDAVEKAWEAGIVVCVAAGNEGPDLKTISSPGIDPRIITVGALDDSNTIDLADDTIASFSSRGPTIDGLLKPDLVTPGVDIVSLRSPNSYLDKNKKDARVGEWYIAFSGTSMATPICAGVTALIMERYPEVTPDQIKDLLKSSCHDINNLIPNIQGSGLVDTWVAIQNRRKNP